MNYTYPRAGSRGNPRLSSATEGLLEEAMEAGVPPSAFGPSLVNGFVRMFRRLPTASPDIDKTQVPLLYSLLGSGTPPLKFAKEDVAYQDRPVGKQQCANCSSAYRNVVTADMICSQVSGTIDGGAWCRIWNLDRH